MRIPCPLCGTRDLREFYYQGAAVMVDRPDAGADGKIWQDYLHNRTNPAGVTRDLWYHTAGCSEWLIVTRNTVTHEVIGADLAKEVRNAD